MIGQTQADSGQNECRAIRTQKRTYAYCILDVLVRKTAWMHQRTESRYRTGKKGQDLFSTGWIQHKTDAGLERCRTGKMQDRNEIGED